MSFFAQDNGSSSSGGGFAAFANVNPWSQNQASSSAAFASTSSRSQPAPIHLQHVEVDVPTTLNAPPSEDQPIQASTFGRSQMQTQSDPLTLFETRLKDFEASQQRKREEEEEQLRRQRQQQQQQFAPPFASSFPTTYSNNCYSNVMQEQHRFHSQFQPQYQSENLFPAQENVFNGPSALGSQTSPWWNPGRVGLGLRTAQPYQGAAFAPDMASIHGVFEMINLAVQVGPACYQAAHRLFSAASQAHAATSQVHAAAADIIAALPYAAPSQYQAQAQTQPLPSWQQPQQPSDSEPFSYKPLDAQSSFWNTAQADFPAPPILGFQNQNFQSPKAYPTAVNPISDSEITKRSEQQRLHIESTYHDLRLAQEQKFANINSPSSLSYSSSFPPKSSTSSTSEQRLPTPPPAYEHAHASRPSQNHTYTYARSRNHDSSSRKSGAKSSTTRRRRRQDAAVSAAAVAAAMAKNKESDVEGGPFLSQPNAVFVR